MTKHGHYIVNACVSAVTLFVKGDLLFSLGIFMAATAPDSLEISYKDPKSYCGYSRLIEHRTITHWWPIWCALWIYALPVATAIASYTHLNIDFLQHLIGLLQGLAMGSLLHIFTDSLSPMGVPLVLPFRKYRKKLFLLYSTGRTEWRVIFPLSFVTLFWIIAQDEQFLQTIKTIIR